MGKIEYYVERADLYISKHIGQRLYIRDIAVYIAGCDQVTFGGVARCKIVSLAMTRYDHYKFTDPTGHRVYVALERTSKKAIDLKLALGDEPDRTGAKDSVDDNAPHELLWRRMMRDFAPYRDCITKTREEAIRWNARHIGKNKAMG